MRGISYGILVACHVEETFLEKGMGDFGRHHGEEIHMGQDIFFADDSLIQLTCNTVLGIFMFKSSHDFYAVLSSIPFSHFQKINSEG